MFNENKILCLIPARGGSKGVPDKNIRNLCGKPLIAYTIEQALASRYIDRVVVDSDDPRILAIGKKFGADTPYVRPKELAGDHSSIFDVLEHAINWLTENENYDFDILVLLHATTPLRNVEDVDGCIRMLFEKNADNVFSVAPSYKNPYFNMVEIDKSTGVARLCKNGSFLNRQETPTVYDMNSSIYVWQKNCFVNMRSHFTDRSYIYEMPRERSVDIDEPFDFKIAEMMMRNSAGEPF